MWRAPRYAVSAVGAITWRRGKMMGLYVGLDIGGTKLIVAASDGEGAVLKRTLVSTPPELDAGLAVLNKMIGEVADGGRIAAIGAAIGGPLDWKRGNVSPLHQPRWRDVPLKAIMEKKWGCPFFVDVDTNVAALGEYKLGGHTVGRFLYITLSTGMGGGLVVDGRIYRGMNGGHPEIGHQSVSYRCSNPDGIRCECGMPDCLEALVSGNGIRRIYHKPAEELNDKEWDEVGYNLGQGLRNLAVIILPDVIVLGGGVAIGGGEKLLATARRVMESHLRIVPVPEMHLSRLGHDTALMGSLVVAREGIC